MKPRKPNTIAEAVMSVIDGIGAAAAAEAVGKTTQLVYTWADPDHDCVPSIRHAMTLDSAFVSAGCGEPPILAMYASRVGCIARPHQRMDPIVRMCEVAQEVGDVAHVLRTATDPESPGGRALTPNERSSISKEIDEAIAALVSLKKDIA